MTENNLKLKLALIECVKNHSGLFAEYEIGEGEFLLVHFNYCKVHNGLEITADFELERQFSSEVINIPCGFVIPFDEYSEDIDSYLQVAGDVISEGYLLPNDLYIS